MQLVEFLNSKPAFQRHIACFKDTQSMFLPLLCQAFYNNKLYLRWNRGRNQVFKQATPSDSASCGEPDCRTTIQCSAQARLDLQTPS